MTDLMDFVSVSQKLNISEKSPRDQAIARATSRDPAIARATSRDQAIARATSRDQAIARATFPWLPKTSTLRGPYFVITRKRPFQGGSLFFLLLV